jgi:hypothetical protein
VQKFTQWWREIRLCRALAACALTWIFAQCASDSTATYSSPVGATATLAPATDLALLSANEAANSAKIVYLALSWNGSGVHQIGQTVDLRFYRDGEEEPFLETTWEDLVRSSKVAGCPTSEGMGEESLVSICEGRLGNLSKLVKVEGIGRESGERKSAVNLSPVFVGHDSARLLVLLY